MRGGLAKLNLPHCLSNNILLNRGSMYFGPFLMMQGLQLLSASDLTGFGNLSGLGIGIFIFGSYLKENPLL